MNSQRTIFVVNKTSIILFSVFLLFYAQTVLHTVLGLNLTSILPHLIAVSLIIIVFVFKKISVMEFLFLGGCVLFFSLISLTITVFDGFWYLYLALAYFSLFKFFKNKSVDFYIFDKIVLFCLAMTALWIVLGLADARASDVPSGYGNMLALVPSEAGSWRINIGPPGSSVHFTGVIASIAIIIAVYRYIFMRNSSDIFYIMLYGYLLFFGGARSVILAVLFGCMVLFLFKIWRRGLSVIVISLLILALLSVYGIQSFANMLGHTNNMFSEMLKLGNLDITSGRAWLWAFHLSLFAENPFGSGSGVLRGLVLGETINGEVIVASSESFFTYLLAVYGWFSMTIFILYISLLLYFSRKGDILKSALLMMALVATAASSLFAGPYGLSITLIGAILASNIANISKTKKLFSRLIK